jgi:hypothetical protein
MLVGKEPTNDIEARRNRMVIRGRDAGAISAAVVIRALLGAGVVHTGPAWAEPLDPNSAAYLNSVRSFVPGTEVQLLHLGWRTCGLLNAGFTPITLSNPEVMHTNIPELAWNL